jgi:hypothetical protein
LSQIHLVIDGENCTAFAVTYTLLAINGRRIYVDAVQTFACIVSLHERGMCRINQQWGIQSGLPGFTDQKPGLGVDSGGQGMFGVGLDWCLWDRAGLGRKAQPPDGCIQGFQLGVFVIELLDFFLDQLRSLFAPLAVAPHSQDVALELFHPLLVLLLPLLVLHHPLLVAGIPTPIQHRA